MYYDISTTRREWRNTYAGEGVYLQDGKDREDVLHRVVLGVEALMKNNDREGM